MKPSLVGAIEAGGTKFVCAIGTDPQNIEEIRFPTTSPEETIQKAIDFFKAKEIDSGKIQAIGIGTFGPAEVNLSLIHI